MVDRIRRALPDGIARLLASVAHRSPRTGRLLVAGARRLAAAHRVGAIGAVVDDAGRVLIVRHTFRSGRAGLPGGWTGRGEDPGDAVVRELREELDVDVEPIAVVACESHTVGSRPRRFSVNPSGITVAYYCRPVAPSSVVVPRSAEITEAAWMFEDDLPGDLTEFERKVIRGAATWRSVLELVSQTPSNTPPTRD